MTERLYYHDSYIREFQARVTGSSLDQRAVYLDRSAFYPSSGGQPHDLGSLGGIPVLDVVDEGDRVAHVLSSPWAGSEDVSGSIDWSRRLDHMQQHTGQHLLSALFAEVLGIETVSFHLGPDSSTIELAKAQVDLEELHVAEERANTIVSENRPVTVGFEDAAAAEGLRKPTGRTGEIRVVTIAGLDRSACGGTHVRATGEIGPILMRSLEKIRGNTRVEFLCGGRAVRRARSDFDLLSGLSRLFSSAIDDLPGLALAQWTRLEESEKAVRRMAAELAGQRGYRAYDETQPGPDGIRRLRKRCSSLTDEIRSEALSFTSRPGALFVAMGETPPALLLASSEGGAPAGEKLKAVLAELGGRGGGNARVAQGSLPSATLLDRAAVLLTGE